MKNHNSLWKFRIFPSGDFSLGANFPPKADKRRDATVISKDSYREFYKNHSFYEVSTNERIITQELKKRFAGRLTDVKLAALFNAYEQKYLDALDNAEFSTAQFYLEKIEHLTSPKVPMGLSYASNSHRPRNRRGLGGITPFGKRMVRSSVTLIERRFKREFLSFGTATLPPLSDSESALICEQWSDIVRKFFQELCRGLERYGLPTDYCQVTEVQSKRFTKTGFMGLHLHWLMPGKIRGRDWCFKPEQIRDIWSRILSNALGRHVSCPAATRVEIPKKSVQGELSKYMTKGADVLQSAIASGRSHLLPRSWWGAAKQLKLDVKSEIQIITGLEAHWLDKHLNELKTAGRIWFCEIYLERDEREIRIGAVGRFNSRLDMQSSLAMARQFAGVSI